MTRSTLELRFHDVPVRVTGGTAELGALDWLLVTGAGGDDAAATARAIELELHSRPPGPALPSALFVEADARGRLVVRDANAEAIVDLESMRIDVRGFSEPTVTQRSATATVITTALQLALREQETIRLHAGVVLLPDQSGAIALAGDSGSGKTTCTLALLQSGCVPMGDDQAFLRQKADEWEFLTSGRSFRLTPRTLSAYPQLRAYCGGLLPELGKHELRISELVRPVERFRGRVRLLFPRLTRSRDTSLSDMSVAEAIGELMVASPLVTVGAPAQVRRHLRLLQGLAEGSGPAWLNLARDVLEQPRAAAGRILGQLGWAAP